MVLVCRPKGPRELFGFTTEIFPGKDILSTRLYHSLFIHLYRWCIFLEQYYYFIGLGVRVLQAGGGCSAIDRGFAWNYGENGRTCQMTATWKGGKQRRRWAGGWLPFYPTRRDGRARRCGWKTRERTQDRRRGEIRKWMCHWTRAGIVLDWLAGWVV